MKQNSMELTILTLCHNQVQYLERCIMSIINLELPFEYEILLSDDASTDGTWELAKQLAKQYKQIKLTRCDTHDYPCYTNSQRSGWNRQNAYKLASGKYIVFMDGDDYYKAGTQVLHKQWVMLETHPECTAAMANNLIIKDGADWDTVCYQDEKKEYTEGQVISSAEYMTKAGLRSAAAFMFRRLENEDNPIAKLRGFFSDTITTAYYLQFGDIICLDNKDSGYVYVQYPKSASHNSDWNAGDWAIWASRCIFIPALIPYWKPIYLYSREYRGSMLATVKRIRGTKRFDSNVVHMFDEFHLWIYDVCAKEKRSIADKWRLLRLEWMIRIPQYIPIKGEWWYKKIWNLMS